MLQETSINCNDWDTKQAQQTCKCNQTFTKQQEIQNFGHKTVFYIGCDGVEWTHLAQHKDMWLAVVCMVMNIIIHEKQLLYELSD